MIPLFPRRYVTKFVVRLTLGNFYVVLFMLFLRRYCRRPRNTQSSVVTFQNLVADILRIFKIYHQKQISPLSAVRYFCESEMHILKSRYSIKFVIPTEVSAQYKYSRF